MRLTAATRQNILYSLAEYIFQPASMIIATPILLRALGTKQYGLWILVNAISATVGGLGSGFGDAATRYVSMYRGREDRPGVARSFTATLVINCFLGMVLAFSMLAAAPILVRDSFGVESALQRETIAAIRISAFVLLLRFVEVVFASSIRAYEQYRPSVVVGVAARALIVASAVALAVRGYGLIQILLATLAVGFLSLTAQGIIAIKVTDVRVRFAGVREALTEIAHFGAFSWFKSVSAVFFSYADRLMIAAVLGPGSLALYALCNQLTQPIHAFVASGFNFLFPNMSARAASGDRNGAESAYRSAVHLNALAAFILCLPFLVVPGKILGAWLGPAFVPQCRSLLVLMAIGHAVLAVGIVPHYTALAMGRVRSLAAMNVAAGIGSLACGFVLMRHVGLLGGGFVKLIAGLVSLFAFKIVRNAFGQTASARHSRKGDYLAVGTD